MSDTRTVTLTEFLLARIAEDEVVATRPHESVRDDRRRDMERIEYDDASGYARMGIGRVLAECEAKRRIVAEHPHVENGLDGRGDGEWECRTCSRGTDGWWCSTLRLLALPFADHPDYDPTWRP
jgi:hypothetical protein